MFGGGSRACARSQQCARGPPRPPSLASSLKRRGRQLMDLPTWRISRRTSPILVKSMPGRACSSATVWEVNRRALAMAPPAPSPTPRPPAFLSGALNDAATRARLAKLDHDREVRADRNVFRAQLLCQLDILNRRIRRLPGSRARVATARLTRPHHASPAGDRRRRRRRGHRPGCPRARRTRRSRRRPRVPSRRLRDPRPPRTRRPRRRTPRARPSRVRRRRARRRRRWRHPHAIPRHPHAA